MAETATSSTGWFWRLFKGAATLGVWAGIIVLGIVAWYATDLPDVDDALNATRRPTVTLLAADGSLLATRGDLYGVPLRVTDLPKALTQAVLATEDRRFYDHFGLDVIGIARAAYRNAREGRIVQGGSTITQQAAKNLFLTPERSLKRKVQEVLLALWLEHKFSKDQILTIYLNRVYLGAGTYGVDAAARKYFGRSAKQLNTYQAAMIAGLLKAPSRYNPRASRERAEARTAQVLKNMVAAGYLSDKQATRWARTKSGTGAGLTGGAGGRYFIDWVLDRVAGYVAPGDNDLSVVTTLNPALQRAAERRLEAALAGPGVKQGASQGALVAMAGDGAVRALVGGRSHAKSPFNRATQARRQPGSAFKPFVYLAALEAGMAPSSAVEDGPLTIDGWAPRNFDGKYHGRVSLSEAMARSLNTAAVRVARRAELTRVARAAARLGIPGEITATPSLALGTHDVSLIDLTAAYAPFANGGQATWPYGIAEIRNGDGKILYARRGSGPGRVIDARHAAAMNAMLGAVVAYGTGKQARLDRAAAGKTGTSQNHRDAWFVGYTADLVAGVWIGNDDGKPMKGVTGGGLPARLWKRFMNDAHKGLAKRPLPGLDGPIKAPEPKHLAKPKAAPAKPKEKGLWDHIMSVVTGAN
ncbi:MAG: PBP1A family penicillin-binding protein [Magnetovibrio sp.]|nr:PBP1A family penicillin-binding protein [Magnetovibrio sp.]